MSANKKVIVSHIEDDGSRKAKVALYNIMNGDHKGLKDAHGQILNVVDFAEFTSGRPLIDSDTGEVGDEEEIVLVLYTKEGDSYATTSKTARKAIEEMYELMTDNEESFPLTEPLECKVISGKCDRGTWYGLKILG